MDTKTQDALKLAIEACNAALAEQQNEASPLRQSLSELEIQRLWHGQTFMEFARDLERAHGIGE